MKNKYDVKKSFWATKETETIKPADKQNSLWMRCRKCKKYFFRMIKRGHGDDDGKYYCFDCILKMGKPKRQEN